MNELTKNKKKEVQQMTKISNSSISDWSFQCKYFLDIIIIIITYEWITRFCV